MRRGALLAAAALVAAALVAGTALLGAPAARAGTAGGPPHATGTAPPVGTAPPNGTAPPDGTAPRDGTAPPDGTDGKVAGVAVPDVPPARFGAEMTRLRADGINTVSIFVWWLLPTRTGTQLARYQGTLSDAALTDEIDTARRAGMQVTLTPLFYCGTCEGGWRGTVEPGEVGSFFARYADFVDHYARIAAETGVSTFFVGSEMTSLERYTARWESVITGVRALYGGRVAYEENWDVLGQARFLGRVDVVGVSAYFPLDDDPAPALAQLRGDWTSGRAAAAPGRDWVAQLHRLATSTGKPILFGETGYMSGDYAAKQPFLNFGGQADWQLQSDLYQALLETFSSQPWWQGVVWWEWFATADNAFDNSRSPRGKTAETLLQRWYAGGARPADPNRPLVLAGASGAHAAGVGGAQAAGQGGGGGREVAADPANAVTAVGGAGIGAGHVLTLAGLCVLLVVLAGACWATLGRPAQRPRQRAAG